MVKKSKVIGIDLGTTYSLASMLDMNDGKLIFCPDDHGKCQLVPSAVVYDTGAEKISVGYPAINKRGINPKTIVSVKRWMEKDTKFDVGSFKMTPQEISAKILEETARQLKETVKSDPSLMLNRAVITVPAYFANNAIKATAEAGHLAHLEVKEILKEPVAAALYYSWKYNLGDATYQVFDLGGGTFDASVVRLIGGEPAVLGISGDNYLGGDDFDRRLAEYIRQRLVNNRDCPYALDLDMKSTEDKLKFTQLTTLAEDVKKELSANETVRINRKNLFQDKHGNDVVINMEISRETFNNLIEDLVNRTITFSECALEEAKIIGRVSRDNIDYILLVGGSTYVPFVKEKLRKHFCTQKGSHSQCTLDKCRKILHADPEFAVSFGAAVRGASFGVDVYDEQKRVFVTLCNPGGTKRETYNLSGKVRIQDSSVNLKGCTVKIETHEKRIQKDAIKQITQPDKQTQTGSFLFSNVPLQKNAINNFIITLLDNAGREIITFDRSIYQGEEFRPISTLLSPSIISKTIYIEVVEGSTLVRKPLFDALTPVPTEKEFIFFTNDTSGFIHARFFQENQIIDVLEVSIDKSLPLGTEVKFHLKIDKFHKITGYGEVKERSFDIHIKSPEDVPFTKEEYEGLVNDFKKLPVEKKLEIEDRERKICKDIDEAFQFDNIPTLDKRGAELRELLREMQHDDKVLVPSKEKFEELVQECRDLGDRAKRTLPFWNEDAWNRTIEIIQKEGEAAYQMRDQQIYGDCFFDLYKRMENLNEHLVNKQIDAGELPDFANKEDVRNIISELLKTKIEDTLEMARARRDDDQIQKINEHYNQIMELRALPFNEFIKKSFTIYKQLQDIEKSLIQDKNRLPKGTLRNTQDVIDKNRS